MIKENTDVAKCKAELADVINTFYESNGYEYDTIMDSLEEIVEEGF